ncbi:HK97-gp10 family putative phage morphogenesis protein [Tsuneonella sp. HG222]
MGFQEMTLDGFGDLEAKLAALPNNIAKNATVRAMRRAGDLMADEMRRLAPRGPTGNLAESIRVSAKSRNLTGLAEYSQTLSAGGSHRDAQSAMRSARRGGESDGTRVFMLIGSNAPHAHLVEFGTGERFWKSSGKSTGVMPAEPFVLPAFLARKDQVLTAMKDEILVEIGKAKTRIANKAAKAQRHAAVFGT